MADQHEPEPYRSWANIIVAVTMLVGAAYLFLAVAFQGFTRWALIPALLLLLVGGYGLGQELDRKWAP